LSASPERHQRDAVRLARREGLAGLHVLEEAHLLHLLVERGDLDRLVLARRRLAGDGADLQLAVASILADAEVARGLVQLLEDLVHLVFLDRRAVLAHALFAERAPALDRSGRRSRAGGCRSG
jgi:hypothetical protein